MTSDEALARLADLSGIFETYTDMQGILRRSTPPTQRALLRANGLPAETDAEVRDALATLENERRAAFAGEDLVIVAGHAREVALPGDTTWQVIGETGEAVLAEGRGTDRLDLPPLPDGVHRLRLERATGVEEVTLIAAPARTPPLPIGSGQRGLWGVMAALYGLRGAGSGELAGYRDLGTLARIVGEKGAGFLGINPVHALGAAPDAAISPYSPTHRGFLNTDHIDPGGHAGACPGGAFVDYAAHRAVHRPALEAAFERFEASANATDRQSFDAFRAAGGVALGDFARFEALSETHGGDSRLWPSEVSRETLAPRRLGFHMWLQWQADVQLGAAQAEARGSGMALGLYLDLAVGARLGGAESFGAGAATAKGVSLGAPPDQLSPAGQNWQLAALSPRRLRHARYEALRFVLRQNMRHCGLLRIDHALGLNRSFWLPEDGSPGGYIRQPFDALMAVIAIEATRAGCVIVGEDLGLVPEGFREEMASRGLFGYSVLQYEKDARGAFLPAQDLRRKSLACFATHDTPTLEGFWQGRDIAWWEKLGWVEPLEAARAVDRRQDEKRQLAGLPAPSPLPQRAGPGLRDVVHARLASAPAELVAVQLDDILCLEEAQNLPGTVDEHPNWRRRCPQTLQEIETGPDLDKTAAIMAHAGRGTQGRKETA